MEEFSVNFGNAKELVLPEEGTYELVVASYEPKEAKKEESRSKGFNVALQFKLADAPEGVSSNFRIYHNLWVDYENPWAAKQFFEALTGQSLEDDELSLTDPEYFIGETVGAALIADTYNGKEKRVVSEGTWYTV